MRRWFCFAGIALLAGITAGCHPAEKEAPPAAESSAGAFAILGGDADSSFARVTESRPFEFPDDHGEHPEYQIEWWYFTGNLREARSKPEASADRWFGFELTFFRIALTEPDERPDRGSEWAADQLYMAHFAITDGTAEQFHFADRLTRGAVGLAGVDSAPWRVWNEGWSAASLESAPGDPSPESIFPARLKADETGSNGAFGLDLTIRSTRPIVLHGDRGYSRKGEDPGNASYYTSFVRLATEGTIDTPAGRFVVEGLAWMDHEWSTSVLGEDLAGWDWFALQFEDGSSLMVFELRSPSGERGEWSQGTWVAADGTVRPITSDDFTVEVTARWTSPTTGITYPAGWTIRVPSASREVTVTPVIANQELALTTTYWEGAVTVRDLGQGATIGRGYVELVGYNADESPPQGGASSVGDRH